MLAHENCWCTRSPRLHHRAPTCVLGVLSAYLELTPSPLCCFSTLSSTGESPPSTWFPRVQQRPPGAGRGHRAPACQQTHRAPGHGLRSETAVEPNQIRSDLSKFNKSKVTLKEVCNLWGHPEGGMKNGLWHRGFPPPPSSPPRLPVCPSPVRRDAVTGTWKLKWFLSLPLGHALVIVTLPSRTYIAALQT